MLKQSKSSIDSPNCKFNYNFRALQVWNSWETLQRVKTKRKEEEQRYIDSMFFV